MRERMIEGESVRERENDKGGERVRERMVDRERE